MTEAPQLPSLHTQSPVLKRKITELKQHMSQACGGFVISITPDDLTCIHGEWKIKQEIRDAQQMAYARFLEQKNIELTQKNEQILQELQALEQELGATEGFTKDEKRAIEGAYRNAERAWGSINGNKQHPDYEACQKNFEQTLRKANLVRKNIFDKSQKEERIKILQNQLVSSKKESDSFNAETLRQAFIQELDGFAIPEDAIIITTKETLPSSSVLGNVRKVVATTLLVSAVAATPLLFSKKVPGDSSHTEESSGNFHKEKNKEVADRIQELNGKSVVECFKHLEQHGDLSRFQMELENALRKNFRKMVGHEDIGTLSDGKHSGDYLTYESNLGNGLLLELGVTQKDLGLAVALHLTKTMNEKNTRDDLIGVMQVNDLMTKHQIPTPRIGIPAPATDINMQRQNAALILQSQVLTSLAEISEYMKKHGYPLNPSQTEILSDRNAGGHYLKLAYSIVGQSYTMEYKID